MSVNRLTFWTAEKGEKGDPVKAEGDTPRLQKLSDQAPKRRGRREAAVEDREDAIRPQSAVQGANGGRPNSHGKVRTELSELHDKFARLAIKQILIPYTNSLIERLMGEIAKRIKNRRMR